VKSKHKKTLKTKQKRRQKNV